MCVILNFVYLVVPKVRQPSDISFPENQLVRLSFLVCLHQWKHLTLLLLSNNLQYGFTKNKSTELALIVGFLNDCIIDMVDAGDTVYWAVMLICQKTFDCVDAAVLIRKLLYVSKFPFKLVLFISGKQETDSR